MKNKSLKFVWIMLGIVFIALFFLTKYSSDYFVAKLYADKNFSLLNKLSGLSQEGVIEYYQGQITDNFTGPLASVFAGGALLFFCLGVFNNLTSFKYCTIIFVYLILSRFEVLFYPPYGEAITGPFSDAVWLARNSLDYVGLHKQGTFAQGGPLMYPMSIYPLILAGLIKISLSAKYFLITIHLLVFVLASIIINTLRLILNKIFDETTARLASLTLLSLPLFQSMAELINLEMACVFFAIISFYFLIERKIFLAFIMSIGSLFIKDPGVITCGNFIFGCVLLFIINDKKVNRRWFFIYPVFLLAVIFLKGYIRLSLIGEQPAQNKLGYGVGWPHISSLLTLKVYIYALILFICFLIYKFIRSSSAERQAVKFLNSNFSPILLFIMSGLWYLLYFNFSVLSERYKLLLSPFLTASLIYLFYSFFRVNLATRIINVITILFFFFSSHGLFYPSKIESSVYNYNDLERSLEYRNDLKINLDMAKYVEDNYAGFTICAPYVTAHALGIPEVGYVHKRMDVVLYGIGPTLGLRQFTGLKYLDKDKTIWVASKKNYSNFPDFPIGPNDKIIKTFTSGNKEVHIYIGGYSIEMARIIYELNKKSLSK